MDRMPSHSICAPPGTKLDDGKLRPGLVLLSMSRALELVARVATDGAVKYTDDGWASLPDGAIRYTEAMLRHLLAEGREYADPESGLPHAAHLACNALIRLELMLREEPQCSGSSSE